MKSNREVEVSDHSLPGVSVIIPVHNGGHHLWQAIRSVFAQNYPWLEVIVVDAGSTDDSVAIARSWGSAVTRLESPGTSLGAARNHGIRHAKGAILGFLDADTLWPTGKLRSLVPRFLENPNLGAALGTVQILGRKPTPLGSLHEAFLSRRFFLGTALVRREIFPIVGQLSERSMFEGEADWFLRAKAGGIQVRKFAEPSLYQRALRLPRVSWWPTRDPLLSLVTPSLGA